MSYARVYATRDFAERKKSTPCSRCGRSMDPRWTADNPNRECNDCQEVERPLGYRAIRKLRQEEQQNPELIREFMEGVDWYEPLLEAG